MSEERRKRQQEKTATVEPFKLSREALIWGGIVVVIALSYLGWWYYRNHRYDDFAKCLATKQTKMYGLYWCPHCADQKRMFGDAFRHVPYTECADGPPGSGRLAPACQSAGLKLFPSWQFGNDPPKEGVLSLEELSAKTGCTLP